MFVRCSDTRESDQNETMSIPKFVGIIEDKDSRTGPHQFPLLQRLFFTLSFWKTRSPSKNRRVPQGSCASIIRRKLVDPTHLQNSIVINNIHLTCRSNTWNLLGSFNIDM